MASSFVLTRIIICAVACAIAITSMPTTGQSPYITALTGNLCRVSSERFEYDVTTGIHSTYRHRFHRRREPVAFVISTSPFVLLLLIIRGGDVSKNPGPADVRRQYLPIDIHALTVAKVSLLAAEHYHATIVTSGHIYFVPDRRHLHYTSNCVTQGKTSTFCVTVARLATFLSLTLMTFLV